jgi:hypothetical protein
MQSLWDWLHVLMWVTGSLHSLKLVANFQWDFYSIWSTNKLPPWSTASG